jgi:hypothetical protein
MNQHKSLLVITLYVSMFIACIGYVSYSIHPRRHLDLVVGYTGSNGHLALPSPQLVQCEKGLMYILRFSVFTSRLIFLLGAYRTPNMNNYNFISLKC